MISGVDPASAPVRHEPIYLEGRLPLVQAGTARTLDLRDGQVVQAIVQNDGRSLLMNLGGPLLALPRDWGLVAGQSVLLMAVLRPNGSVLLQPAAQGTAASATAGILPPPTPAPSGKGSTSAAGVTEGSSTAASRAFGAGLGIDAAGSAAAAPSEVLRLAQRGDGQQALLNLLSSEHIGEWLAQGSVNGHPLLVEDTVRRELLLQWRTLLRQINAITPAAIREAVMNSGLFTEALLAQGQAAQVLDTKALLRRLLRAMPEQAGREAVDEVRGAIDDIESSQLQAVSAQVHGQMAVSLVVPFMDGMPVELKFSRARSTPDNPDPPFIVDVHTRHAVLGPLWLRTSVENQTRIGLTMWAEWPRVAQQARATSEALRREMSDSGLQLVSFEVLDGARPAQMNFAPPPDPMLLAPAGDGHLLDIKA